MAHDSQVVTAAEENLKLRQASGITNVLKLCVIGSEAWPTVVQLKMKP